PLRVPWATIPTPSGNNATEGAVAPTKVVLAETLISGSFVVSLKKRPGATKSLSCDRDFTKLTVTGPFLKDMTKPLGSAFAHSRRRNAILRHGGRHDRHMVPNTASQ